MKIKLTLTALLLVSCQYFSAQEMRQENISDSTKTLVPENVEIKKAEEVSQKDVDKVAKKLQNDEEKAKRNADKVVKEKEKMTSDAEERQKDIEKNQKKLEKQQDKIQKEQKKFTKQQEKIANAEDDLAKAKEKLSNAQSDLFKDSEKHNKKLLKGKLSPNDITAYEKDKIKQESRIQDLKGKIEKEEKILRKSRN